MYVVPELSARTSGVMAWDGRVTPGLRAAICEAFHVVMVPSKMPARVGAVELDPGRDAGEVVGHGDATQDVRDLDDRAGVGRHLGQVGGGHRHVGGGEGHGAGLEGGDAGARADALVVDLQGLVEAGVLVEGRTEERLDEGRARGVERAARCLQVGGQVGARCCRRACRRVRWWSSWSSSTTTSCTPTAGRRRPGRSRRATPCVDRCRANVAFGFSSGSCPPCS